MEVKAAVDSGVCVVAERAGTVESSTSKEIVVREEDGKKTSYKLTKFQRSNQSNCYNQRPIVNKGDVVAAGQVIADGPSTSGGEMALGKNPLIGFMTWEGGGCQLRMLFWLPSEKTCQDDVYILLFISKNMRQRQEIQNSGPERSRERYSGRRR